MTRSTLAGFLAALALLLPAARLTAPATSSQRPLIAPAFVAVADGRFAAPGPGRAQIGVAADRLAVRDGDRFGQVRLLGADRAARAVPEGVLPGRVNLYRGTTRHEALTRHERVRFREVWDGIDVVYHGLEGGLEYDFALAPGADPSQIALRRTGELPQRPPRAFQDGREVPVALRDDDGILRFELGDYDRSRPLLIDPVVVFSTYLGGSEEEQLRAVDTDAAGNVFVAGSSRSPDFPTPNGFQTTPGGAPYDDAVAAKLAPDGSLLWATYLGGSAIDDGTDLAVGPDGSVVVTGQAGSGSFPTTAGTCQPNYVVIDPFAAKLGPGGQLLWSTLFGNGKASDANVAIAADGRVFLAGSTRSGLPMYGSGYQQTFGGGSSDGFVAELSAAGACVWTSYVGGTGDDNINDMAVAPDGTLALAGRTTGAFPVTAGAAQPAFGGGSGDVFAARMTAAGAALPYATYLGGTSFEDARGIAVDPAGALLVSGVTQSADFPVAGAAQPAYGGGLVDGFVAKLAAGGALSWSTFLGGSTTDLLGRLAAGQDGAVYAVGASDSTDLPLTGGGAPSLGGGLLAAYAPGGRLRTLSTENISVAGDVTIDAGTLVIAGTVFATNLPTTPGAAQPAYGGGDSDGYVERVRLVSGVDAAGASFGEAAIGAAVDRTVTVSSTGETVLDVGSITLGGAAAGDYAVTSNGCSGGIEPRSTCAIGVRFTPAAVGERAATLTVASNAPGSPQTVSLTGTGTPAPIPPSPPPPPPPAPEPPLVLRCAGLSIVLLDVHEQGGRVRVGGIALARYAGQRVTIAASRGKQSAGAVVQADGSFAATLPRPKRRDYRKVVYRATVAGQRSPALHVYRNFTITSTRETARGLQVVARVRGGKKGQKATLRRQVSCKETTPTSTVKLGRNGVLRLTLPKPAAGSGFVFYRVITRVRGFTAFTLPIAVKSA
jgi:hypothetical protein